MSRSVVQLTAAAAAGIGLAAALATAAPAAPKNPWSTSEQYQSAAVSNANVRFYGSPAGTVQERATNAWTFSNTCKVLPGDIINRYVRNGDGTYEVFSTVYTWGSDTKATARGDQCTTTVAEPKTYSAAFKLDSNYGRMEFVSSEGPNFAVIWVDTRKPRLTFFPSTVANGQAQLRYAITDDGEYAAAHIVIRKSGKVIADAWGSLEDATGKQKTLGVYLPSGLKKGPIAVCLTPQDKAKNSGAPACRTLVVR